MKKNAIITINDKEAQVTKAFAKQARIFGTPEYREWKEFLNENPGFKMVTKTIKKNANKRTYKNLTYANMERFLKSQDNGEELLKKFNTAKEAAAIQQNPYRAVLAWFLQAFPDYDNYKAFFTGEDMESEETFTEKASANVTIMKSEIPAA